MLVRLAVAGALGYFAYALNRKTPAEEAAPAREPTSPAPDIELAGGPLSSRASVQHDPDQPPMATPDPLGT